MMNNNKSILVIEDDPDIGIMIKTILEYNHYSVELIERGEEVEKVANNTLPHLIIMDMLLSGVNGTDICYRLKKENTTSHIPIIMFSAHPNAEKICMDAGAEDFIAKPFDMNELLAKINLHLS